MILNYSISASLALVLAISLAVSFARRVDVTTNVKLEAELGELNNEQVEQASSGKTLNVLHFNLCWECMSAATFGSGKITGARCKIGTLTGPDGRKRFASTTVASADKKDLITSCAADMLLNMESWNTKHKFDIATFVELCSPQENNADTSKWGGFDESDESKRQCGLGFYTGLKTIFNGHTFVLNYQPGQFAPIHQLTAYKDKTFSGYRTPKRVMTSITVGRPLTALVFVKKAWAVNFTGKTAGMSTLLLLNVHNIHFRKALINKKLIETLPGGPKDATGMIQYAKDNYKSAGGTCDEGELSNSLLEVDSESQFKPNLCFSVAKCPTACLQKLFGGFLEKRIRDEADAETKPALEGITRIIMGGDFNDETGELNSIPMFGKTVQIAQEKRKRTCCSDRDKRWIDEYVRVTGNEYPGDYRTLDSYPDHAKANWEYLTGQCHYGTKDEIRRLSGSSNTVPLFGEDKAAETDVAGEHSRFPFGSDMILDSKGVTTFGFPEGYKQDLHQPMSDHDPIVATLPSLAMIYD